MATNGAPPGNGMAPPPPQTANALIYPALHLFPLNETFVPKQILLAPPGERIKIGRQTNAKTVPNSSNGYFDSKVLSRMHAEVWCEESKVYIKDVKSSNGTFINGDRLSAEGVESDIFELHSDDIVEFGIDIVGDDNKTIIHHKVAAKVHLVFTAEDALMMNKNMPSYFRSVHDAQLSRRASKPGQAAFSFDHVLTRLQSELQKSRETGVELNTINGVMSDIHDTLGGTAPLPAYTAQGRIPAMMPPPGPRDPHAQTIAALQAQLVETQHALAQHADKVRGLESLLAEHDMMKSDVHALRMQMDEAKREMEGMLRAGRASSPLGGTIRGPPPGFAASGEDDDSDSRSIASIDTIRPQTPDLPRDSTDQDDDPSSSATKSPARHRSASPPPSDHRIDSLAAEVATATALSHSLRDQHATSSESTRALEARLSSLESRVVSAETDADGRWDGWKRAFEASWQKDRDEWTSEREKLYKAVADWERARAEETSSSEDDEGVAREVRSLDPPSTASTSSSPGLAGSYPRSPVDPTTNGVVTSRGKKSSSRRRRRRSSSSAPRLPELIGEGAARSARDVVGSRGWITARAERADAGGVDGEDEDDADGDTTGMTPEPTMRQGESTSRTAASSSSLATSNRKASSNRNTSTALPLASALGVLVMGIAVYSVVVRRD